MAKLWFVKGKERKRGRLNLFQWWCSAQGDTDLDTEWIHQSSLFLQILTFPTKLCLHSQNLPTNYNVEFKEKPIVWYKKVLKHSLRLNHWLKHRDPSLLLILVDLDHLYLNIKYNNLLRYYNYFSIHQSIIQD